LQQWTNANGCRHLHSASGCLSQAGLSSIKLPCSSQCSPHLHTSFCLFFISVLATLFNVCEACAGPFPWRSLSACGKFQRICKQFFQFAMPSRVCNVGFRSQPFPTTLAVREFWGDHPSIFCHWEPISSDLQCSQQCIYGAHKLRWIHWCQSDKWPLYQLLCRGFKWNFQQSDRQSHWITGTEIVLRALDMNPCSFFQHSLWASGLLSSFASSVERASPKCFVSVFQKELMELCDK
jgi:hypothetical protein